MSNAGWLFGAGSQLALCVVLFALAIWRGAAPERILAGWLLAACMMQQVFHPRFSLSAVGMSVEPGHLLFDLVLLMVIAPIALHANRVYPLLLGGAQLVALSSHLARAALSSAAAPAILAIDEAAFDLQLAGLALGLGFHIMRQRRLGGEYPSWRPDGPSTDWIH